MRTQYVADRAESAQLKGYLVVTAAADGSLVSELTSCTNLLATVRTLLWFASQSRRKKNAYSTSDGLRRHLQLQTSWAWRFRRGCSTWVQFIALKRKKYLTCKLPIPKGLDARLMTTFQVVTHINLETSR